MNVIQNVNNNYCSCSFRSMLSAALCCSETLWNEILEDSKDSRSIGTVDDGQTEHGGDARSLPYYRVDCKQTAQVA
jgi:hypothetical protein